MDDVSGISVAAINANRSGRQAANHIMVDVAAVRFMRELQRNQTPSESEISQNECSLRSLRGLHRQPRGGVLVKRCTASLTLGLFLHSVTCPAVHRYVREPMASETVWRGWVTVRPPVSSEVVHWCCSTNKPCHRLCLPQWFCHQA